MYAAIVKGVGLAALLIGGFAGGAVARALPLASALWVAAFLQMFSNLAFVWLGYQTPSAEALTVAIVVENFSGAIGTVIFVAYLSALCRNPLHTATQYALLTALASTGRTLFSSGPGFAAQELGWPLFFLGTSLTAIPALMLMVWLQGRGHFRALDDRSQRLLKSPAPLESPMRVLSRRGLRPCRPRPPAAARSSGCRCSSTGRAASR